MALTTRYARSDGASIAYRVIGEGATDLLILPGWISHVEQLWEAPPLRRFFERLTEFSRLILFDRRGTGLSDDIGPGHTLEQDVLDALAVLDAAGSERTALYTKWTGGPVGALLAADHPARVTALIMYASVARTAWAPDYEWAWTAEQRDRFVESSVGEWGQTGNRELARWAPSMADDADLAAWFARLERLIASPGQARARWREAADLDVRETLPRIHVPTLVMHRPEESIWDVRHSLFLSEHIPGARFVELEGVDSLDFVGDSDSILEEMEEFITGVRGGGEGARALLTVMFTDIVDSTRRAAELGDGRWRDLLAGHDQAVRAQITRYGGREIKTTGDGFLVAFSGPPSTALRCAQAIRAAESGLEIEVRIGLHIGECELIGEDIGGMAVHIASRISGMAKAGEVLVSGTVSGAVAGGRFSFEDRGAQGLKGVPGTWSLLALQN